MLAGAMRDLAERLGEISKRGPVASVGAGPTAVGMTLLGLLGIPYSSTSKPSYEGIVITARRGTKAKDPNRVSLFAKVPDWDISACKSSREILDRFGYEREGARKLYCTVRARHSNSQGLKLHIDRDAKQLLELQEVGSRDLAVAAWRIAGLESKLQRSHHESAWVVAVPSMRHGHEFFHFRHATFTSAPRAHDFVPLIDQGTVTMDHLISNADGLVVEKGPLFKIKPENVSALFPVCARVDLLAM